MLRKLLVGIRERIAITVPAIGYEVVMPDRVFWSSALYGAFLALAFAVLPCASWAADSWQGKVVQVVDGATLDIAKPDGQVERVRL